MSNVPLDEFHNFYQEKIEPLLKDLEVERDEAQKKCEPFKSIIKACCVMGFIFFIFLPSFFKFFSFILFCIALSYAGRVWSIYTKLRNNLKKDVISKILSLYGNMYFVERKDIIKYSEIKEMGIFPKFREKEDDDIVIGVYKNCNFVISESYLWHVENKHAVNDFKGLIMKIQMNKNFTGKTIVGMKGYINKPDKDFEKVELESVDFMKDRCVYSTDQINARYILTTSFMERIESLGRVFNDDRASKEDLYVVRPNYTIGPTFRFNPMQVLGYNSVLNPCKGVNVAFINGYVYLFIPTNEDFFEIPIEDSLLNEKLYYNICSELDSIMGIIEYLHLDQKLGM